MWNAAGITKSVIVAFLFECSDNEVSVHLVWTTNVVQVIWSGGATQAVTVIMLRRKVFNVF